MIFGIKNLSSKGYFFLCLSALRLLLRQSEYVRNYEQIIELGKNAKGSDEEGYRAEFIKLVKTTQMLDKTMVASNKD